MASPTFQDECSRTVPEFMERWQDKVVKSCPSGPGFTVTGQQRSQSCWITELRALNAVQLYVVLKDYDVGGLWFPRIRTKT